MLKVTRDQQIGKPLPEFVIFDQSKWLIQRIALGLRKNKIIKHHYTNGLTVKQNSILGKCESTRVDSNVQNIHSKSKTQVNCLLQMLNLDVKDKKGEARSRTPCKVIAITIL